MKQLVSQNTAHLAATIVAVGTVLGGTFARAEDANRERQVEAAFIYNFTQFIEWPRDGFGSESEPFVIGILGNDPFDGLLARMLAGKKVGSHPVQVVHVPTASDLGRVSLLYVPASSDAQAAAVVSRLGDRPTLTIGQTESFMAAGGGIRLYTEDRRMRFQISIRATDRARLKISSKLLNLAKPYDK